MRKLILLLLFFCAMTGMLNAQAPARQFGEHESPNGCKEVYPDGSPLPPHWHWRVVGANPVGPPLLTVEDLKRFLAPGPDGRFNKSWQVLWMKEGPQLTEADLRNMYDLAIQNRFVTGSIQPCELLEDMMSDEPPRLVKGPNGERLRTLYDPTNKLAADKWELPSLERALQTGQMQVINGVFVKGCSNPTHEIKIAVETQTFIPRLEKTNDANGDGIFTDDEQSRAQRQRVPFQYRAINPSAVRVRITRYVDDIPGIGVVNICANQIGRILEPNTDAVCTQPVDDYSPAPGSQKINTATVTMQMVDRPNITATATDSSTVRTLPTPGLKVTKEVRNITQNSEFGKTATARPNDILQFRIQVNTEGANIPQDIFLRDVISDPQRFTFVPESLRINLATSAAEQQTLFFQETGTSIGTVPPNGNRVLTFDVRAAASFEANITHTMINTVIAWAGNLRAEDTASVTLRIETAPTDRPTDKPPTGKITRKWWIGLPLAILGGWGVWKLLEGDDAVTPSAKDPLGVPGPIPRR